MSTTQLLIRLPDTSNMKAVAKIPEAMAMKLRQGKDMQKFPVSVRIVDPHSQGKLPEE